MTTMQIDRAVVQQALELLGTWAKPPARLYRVLDALRAALAQQEEPCPNCASLEAQNTELDRKLAELELAVLKGRPCRR
jgi:hypothetical protein